MPEKQLTDDEKKCMASSAHDQATKDLYAEAQRLGITPAALVARRRRTAAKQEAAKPAVEQKPTKGTKRKG